MLHSESEKVVIFVRTSTKRIHHEILRIDMYLINQKA